MRQIALVVVVSALMLPTAASGYTFGDWASDRGYDPGHVMPDSLEATETSPAIDSLDGISEFNWTATPTRALYLYDNQISSIESGAFSGLTYLEKLYVSNNQISSIESGDFSGLANLTDLHLAQNQISSIESGDFSGLTNLNILRLWQNQISSIESGDFSGLTNLEHLGLGSNQISSIEVGDFSGLTNLEHLWLVNNQISSIESGAFSGLTNLEFLWLANNQISSIESGVFSGLANLERLFMGGDEALIELNFEAAVFSSLNRFGLEGNVNITSVSLKNAVVNQTSLAVLLDGGTFIDQGPFIHTGIGELDGITEMNLSGIDFADISDLGPLYVMDDLTDLWLVNTANLDASDLDVLLDNLAAIDNVDENGTEGVLYMTQANFDAFDTAGGGLLAAWDAEPGHRVAILMLGDMDGDGNVDFDDIEAFALGLIDPQEYEDLYGMPPEWKGDTDADGDQDFDDIPGFVEMLGGVTAVPEPTSLLLVLVGIAGLVGVRRRIA